MEPLAQVVRPKILLIEDLDPVARAFADLLGYAFSGYGGCTVFRVRSLAEARQELLVPGYDVSLVDLNLPDSVGLETIIAFRKINIYSTPFVALTGESMGENEQVAAMILGAAGFLVKSELAGHPNWLRKAIRFAMARTAYTNDVIESTARFLAAALEKKRADDAGH